MQDLFLSLCYGRPVYAVELSPHFLVHSREPSDYQEFMWSLSTTALQVLRPDATRTASGDNVRDCVHAIQELQQLFKTTTSGVLSRANRLEHHAFKLYSSFIISFFCQRRLRDMQGLPNQERQKSEWSDRLTQALVDTIMSFLGLHAISMLSLRIWTMKHMSLSSALLLGFRANLKHQPTLLQKIEAFIDVFSTAANDIDEDSLNTLTVPHARALAILKELCSKNTLTRVPDGPDPEVHLYDDQTPGPEMSSAGEDGEPFLGDNYDPAVFWDDAFFELLTGNTNNPPSAITDPSWLDDLQAS